jgi:hypothetical protein
VAGGIAKSENKKATATLEILILYLQTLYHSKYQRQALSAPV